MHDTAMAIGKIFLDLYWEDNFSRIVELGSYDVNGTLRTFQPANSSWIGLDAEPGPSVDVCIRPGDALPLADESADVVLATSMFEHDELFWMTFIELCRITKPGGFIYINAPSNGLYHRYPQDCWRFYPDASRALEKWARSQRVEISLSESFVANRQAHGWNDFVAIFAKSPRAPRAEARFVYSRVPCRNVHRMGEPSFLFHRNTTEDMDLMNRHVQTIRRLRIENELHVASQPAPGGGSAAQLRRLFTIHRTVVYVDPASGQLRHGLLDGSPANAWFAADGARGVIMVQAAGALQPVACLAKRADKIDGASEGDAQGAATMFETVRLPDRWFGLRAAGLFLSAEGDGSVTLSRQSCGPAECFLLVPLPLQYSPPPISPGALDVGHLQELVGTTAPVILDIGANDGATTAKLLRAFPDCTIYAFEPDPRAIARFKNRIKDSRVTLFEMAIGAEDGDRIFHVSSGSQPGASSDEYKEGWDQSGSLRAPKSHKQVWPWVKFESTMTVPVRRLDTWAREHAITNVDFIWADVQGAEGDLVAGGLVTLAKTRYFYVEYSNDEWYEGQPTLQQLTEMLNNFVVVRRFPMDVLFRNATL